MTPRPGAAPAAIAAKPLALRAQAFATTAAVLLSAGRSDNINTNNNRREVGPLQPSAMGPPQTAAPIKDELARWPGELERWHAFSEERQRGRARSWLAAAGYRVLPVDHRDS
jgi:hypothetical protein